MNSRNTKIAVVGAWLLVATTAFGQEVYEKETGLYATKEIKNQVNIGSQNKVIIRSAVHLSGKITLQTRAGKDVQVVYTKQARTSDRDRATDYIDLIEVTLSVVADQARLEMRAPNPAPWKEDEAGIVELVVTVPPEAQVDIEAQAYDIKATGPLKGLVIPQSLGGLDVSDISGNLDITTANRKITLRNISGNISAATSNSSIDAREITATSGQARFRNEGGDISIEQFTGSINVKNSYGRIEITQFEPTGSGNYIRSASGPIVLELSSLRDAKLVVTNQYEDIEITVPDTISAYMSLKVDEDGVIEAAQFPFKADLVERDRLNLHAGDGDGEISGTVRGKGNIYVRGTKGD